jgi:hypothetical protein
MQRFAPEMFLANGFPFDLPPPGGAFANYLTMVYHMVLLVAFSQGEWTKNVWGGCMLLRAVDLRRDTHGLVSKYRDGGYSDDLILAALCDQHKRLVGCPHDAIFPQHMPARQSLQDWWNYMQRQLFVMDTYATPHNRRVNHGMLLALSYLSLAVTSAMALSALDILCWAVAAAAPEPPFDPRGSEQTAAAAAAAAAVAAAHSGTPRLSCGAWESAADNMFPVRAFDYFPPQEHALSLAVFAAFALALTGARAMYRQMGLTAHILGDRGAMAAVEVHTNLEALNPTP